jgi:homogentisate 1,2-dioxygenase
MATKVFTATEKTTGRTWMYQTRRTYGRREFRFPLFDGQWSPTLRAAKEAAKAANRFRYDDEPALVTVESLDNLWPADLD